MFQTYTFARNAPGPKPLQTRPHRDLEHTVTQGQVTRNPAFLLEVWAREETLGFGEALSGLGLRPVISRGDEGEWTQFVSDLSEKSDGNRRWERLWRLRGGFRHLTD